VTGRWPVAALVAGLVAGLAAAGGCADGGGDRPAGGPALAELSSPLAACDQLAEPPGGAGPSAEPTGGAGPSAGADPPAGPGGDPLLELSLPCLTGGEPFRLADLRGPAVVNLWASWCPPCREELLELQRYADQQAGRVHVLGVVTEDDPERAAALATDLRLRFPAVADREGRLRAALAAIGLPVTLLVDSAGRVRHVHRTGALDEPAVARLARDHLGVGE
jgi:thiol-disulfide isomerase/thioredoxin